MSRPVARRRVAAAAAMVLLAASRLEAGELVYAPPAGFWIDPSDHSQALYGPSHPSANWNVAQWDIPQDLPPFDATGVSANRWARVAWLQNGQFELAQDGSGMPCNRDYRSGRTLASEFDLLAQPNNHNTPRFPQAALAADLRLADLAGIDGAITLSIRQARILDESCPATQGDFVYAVVLSNIVRHQLLFYQLRLALANEAKAVTGWFFRGANIQSGQGGQWGYGDNVTQYGQPWARAGVTQPYRFPLLPHLAAIIQRGEDTGIDGDLSHWRLTGTYVGQAIWGHVRSDALWSGFALKATKK